MSKPRPRFRAPAAQSNALPLDTADRICLADGIEARYGLCPCASLKPNPAAVRVHPKRQIKKLARSIEVTAPLAPVIIDEDYVILAGHARVAAIRPKSEVIPVVQVFGLSEAQKLTYLHSDNRIGEDSRLDREKLALGLPDLMVVLEAAGLDFADTGFEIAECDALTLDFADTAVAADEVDPALRDEPPILRRGDVLQLGLHRLAVGDALDPDLLDRLMGGVRAEAAFLDVPYNLSMSDLSARGTVRHPEFAFASGEMDRAEFVAFLKAAFGNAARVSTPGAVHFACIDWRHVHHLIEAGEAVYDAYLTLVAWNKTNAGQGGLYRNQHELIAVFRVGEERHRDNVQQGRLGRNRSNVWTYPGGNSFRAGRQEDLAAHPTVKPVQLVADALKDVTRRGAIVLDAFVGSGTTILAGEQVGRCVRAVEIEPRYAQIAVRRWERMTGHAAVCAETGRSLDELLLARADGEASGEPAPDTPAASPDLRGAAAQPAVEGASPTPLQPRIRIRTRAR